MAARAAIILPLFLEDLFFSPARAEDSSCKTRTIHQDIRLNSCQHLHGNGKWHYLANICMPRLRDSGGVEYHQHTIVAIFDSTGRRES